MPVGCYIHDVMSITGQHIHNITMFPLHILRGIVTFVNPQQSVTYITLEKATLHQYDENVLVEDSPVQMVFEEVIFKVPKQHLHLYDVRRDDEVKTFLVSRSPEGEMRAVSFFDYETPLNDVKAKLAEVLEKVAARKKR